MKLKNLTRKISTKENISNIISTFHPSQTNTLNESLILVDVNDRRVGNVSKLNGHLKCLNNEYPHRAFSVFLFNSKNEMLLQQRSLKKFTFPGLWSNTCCSHPLDNIEENEMKGNIGIKRAAVRRMKIELGLDTKVEDYVTTEKILYRADSNETFEEFELDYILLAKMNIDLKELNKTINKDEVHEVYYYSKEDLLKEIKGGMGITPWFGLMIKNKIDDLFYFSLNLSSSKFDEETVRFTKFL